MAAPMWRMNGLWRRMAGVLVLCSLLLSNEVVCQEDATDAPSPGPPADASAVTNAAGSAAAPGTTAAPDGGADLTAAVGEESAASAAPGNTKFPATILNIALNADTSDTSGTTISSTVVDKEGTAAPEVRVDSHIVKAVVPDVKCVGEKDNLKSNVVEAEVETNDCEATKLIIQENPAPWCPKENCNLEIFQDGKTMMVASDDAELSNVAEVLQSPNLKDKLGLTKVEIPSSSGSSVFVGILVTGLLAAIAITVGYFKCQRRSDTKGVRLADEAYPVDQENQGNTLVSVAPLNPPPETQEKPSVNGESPEAAKTQPPPPTNGHSTTKTADTEL